MTVLHKVLRTIQTEIWLTVTVTVMVMMVASVSGLSGPNVCMVEQKYNITKRVKYRAPMSVRTYEWCFAMPPRCSKWSTEMRDVTRLETEERTAEMAVCCPGFKLKDISCVPTCPSGKTGHGCSEDCPSNKWGPSCAHDCKQCIHGSCDSVTGECRCQDGWQGESCETSMTTTAAPEKMEQLLTTEFTSTKTTIQPTPTISTRNSTVTTPATTASSNLISSTSTTATNIAITSSMSSISTTTEMMQTTIATIPTSRVTLPTTTKVFNPITMQTTPKNNEIFSNESLSKVPMSTLNTYTIVTEDQRQYGSDDKEIVTENIAKETRNTAGSSYNRTEGPSETVKIVTSNKEVTTAESTTEKNDLETRPILTSPTTRATTESMTTQKTIVLTTTTVKPETKKPSTTVRQPMTTKVKPKEIWIKPAQKGESPIVETKHKSNQELPHSKFKHKEIIEITTPKTIVVSIIPTSVTYVSFKKLAFTTVSSMSQKNKDSTTNIRTTERDFTKPTIFPTTSTPFTIKYQSRMANLPSTINLQLHQNVTKSNAHTSTTGRPLKTSPPTKPTTNSMPSTLNVANKKLNSSLLTTVSSFPINATTPARKLHPLSDFSTSKTITTAPSKHRSILVTEKAKTERVPVQKQSETSLQRNDTNLITKLHQVTKTFSEKQAEINSKRNLTNTTITANIVTDDPSKDEETFHILTEPEHITAIMGDKENERSTINLISVISIAGGVMMAVITVAVVIVMLERCKKPRYEDVRKFNDIRMQVMIDNNDVPPPYVRSIFHTPLPDPPTSEKCHYQPISTLDRNLKQFMRPVVVQTISPLMLENFRGILECHYDHLPRRTQDEGVMHTRCSVAPSIDEREELLPPPPRVHSLTDSDIEAMKCEAKLDVIDNTTSEPLYAEIPCWRPPSAHAIEVVNLNGEAVTEL